MEKKYSFLKNFLRYMSLLMCLNVHLTHSSSWKKFEEIINTDNLPNLQTFLAHNPEFLTNTIPSSRFIPFHTAVCSGSQAAITIVAQQYINLQLHEKLIAPIFDGKTAFHLATIFSSSDVINTTAQILINAGLSKGLIAQDDEGNTAFHSVVNEQLPNTLSNEDFTDRIMTTSNIFINAGYENILTTGNKYNNTTLHTAAKNKTPRALIATIKIFTQIGHADKITATTHYEDTALDQALYSAKNRYLTKTRNIPYLFLCGLTPRTHYTCSHVKDTVQDLAQQSISTRVIPKEKIIKYLQLLQTGQNTYQENTEILHNSTTPFNHSKNNFHHFVTKILSLRSLNTLKTSGIPPLKNLITNAEIEAHEKKYPIKNIPLQHTPIPTLQTIALKKLTDGIPTEKLIPHIPIEELKGWTQKI